MTVTTRTNLLTNTSFELDAAEWTSKTNCTSAVSTTQVYVGTQSLAVIATASGAVAITTTSGTGGVPVTASTAYNFSAYIRTSATPRAVTPVIVWYTSAGAVISSSLGTPVTDGFSWLRANVQATSPSNAAFCAVQLAYASEAASEVHYIDAALLEKTTILGPFFDGSFTSGGGVAYAWTGTANASTSTMATYVPTVTVVGKTDAPCPRVEVTIQDLGTGTTIYNIWRTADSVRKIVRSSRNRSTVGSDALIDYEAPLGRTLTYDIEVVSGLTYLSPTNPGTATVTSATWWIQDPLVPSSAIPLAVSSQDTAIPCLTAAAVKGLEYAADVTIIPILGSSEPVALMGTRQVAGGVDFSMFTRAAEATTTLRNLIQQTPLLLVRTNGVRNDGVPALAYFVSAKPVEHPVTVAFGGTLTNWQLQGDLVAAPSLNVLVPIWTYGTVAALWATYQQAQTTLAGKRYLDVLKSPSGV